MESEEQKSTTRLPVYSPTEYKIHLHVYRKRLIFFAIRKEEKGSVHLL